MTAGLLALGMAAAALPASAFGASAGTTMAPSATTCAGRAATIVSDAREVTGTPGADVIVVRSRIAEVDAGAGDDRICVRGPRGYTSVDAGEGDDRVQVESRTDAFAWLGAGRNTYRGGPGSDTVASGSPGDANHDRVVLADGADHAYLVPGADHRRAVLLGGAGSDEIRLEVRSGHLHVDAAARLAAHRGAAYATWRSFEAHALFSNGAQEFTGSGGDDDVSFGGGGSVTATTLGGDDAVWVSVDADQSVTTVTDGVDAEPRTPASRVALDLGDGHDALDLASWDTLVRVDLTQGRVDLSTGDTTGSFGFLGVEDVVVRAETPRRGAPPTRVVLVGDDQENRLQADACRVELLGGGGDDHLRVGFPPPTSFLYIAGGQQVRRCRRSSDVDGGAGDDVLVSRAMDLDLRGFEDGDRVRAVELPVRDVLDGGEGNDTADAGKGTDTCLAEVRVDCEA